MRRPGAVPAHAGRVPGRYRDGCARRSEESNLMLILSRCLNQALIINGNIKVIILAVNGGNVRLGVDADRSIPVDRKEVRERKCQEAGSRQPPQITFKRRRRPDTT